MNKKQRTVFYSLWLSFCLYVTLLAAVTGEFNLRDTGEATILVITLVLCAIPIYLWVKSNKDLIDDL